MPVSSILRKGIGDKVFFTGGRNGVPDILAALDLFVFSSLHEGLPIAVAETMLANVPLIVSGIEPLVEATGNGKYAEVFKPKDEKDLAEKILKLLKGKPHAKNWRKKPTILHGKITLSKRISKI